MRIVYFDIDCLRPDHLGCYGYRRPTSPAIDQIASQGVRFERYYCSSSPCLPSRTVWSSGRFGIRNGVISNHGAGAQFHIRQGNYGGPKADNEMLTRQLRRGGYDTISFSNFADRHSALWFMCGWSEYHTPNLMCGAETAEQVNAPLMHWLKHNATRENYLLHVNYWDAHRVFKMDASWADRFAGMPAPAWPDEPTIAGQQDLSGAFTPQHLHWGDGVSQWPLMPDSISGRADYEHLVTGYDAAIAYVDHHVAQVLEELDRQGVLEDAAVIISGDHGDALGEHGIYSDHVCADECNHHIPLIVKWPGVTQPGRRDEAMLYNADLPPTLCELLGMEAPGDWDGESFAGNLRGDDRLDREYLVWDCALYAVQRVVRTRQHLLMETYDDYGYRFEPTELYDMEGDPYETRNLAAERPELVSRHRGMLSEWLGEQMRKPHWRGDPLGEVLRERSQQ